METFSVPLQIVAVVAVVGALVETYMPGIITDRFKQDASSITIGLIGIVFSTLFLMVFLKGIVREGFQDTEAMTNWKQLVNFYKLQELCKMFPDIYQKILTVQKGAPPSVVTDAQARESTDKLFKNEMRSDFFSCSKFEAVQKAQNINTFFSALYDLDNDFFIQAYETAIACRRLLIRQYNDVKAAQQQQKEGFQGDDALCEKDVGEERRKMIRDKYLEAQKYLCKLPEEFPTEKKEEFAKKKLATLAAMLESHKQKNNERDTMNDILNDCTYYMEQLEKEKKKAEDTSNKYDFNKAPPVSAPKLF